MRKAMQLLTGIPYTPSKPGKPKANNNQNSTDDPQLQTAGNNPTSQREARVKFTMTK